MLAAVRVRGVPDARKKASQVMRQLQLHNKNNCMLLPDDDQHRGMLQQVKDYVAYGSVSEETVADLLRKRGTVNGEAIVDELDEFDAGDVEDIAARLADEETTIWELRSKGLQVPFRLNAPSKGFRDTRRHHGQGGSLGNRDEMDGLLQRMI